MSARLWTSLNLRGSWVDNRWTGLRRDREAQVNGGEEGMTWASTGRSSAPEAWKGDYIGLDLRGLHPCAEGLRREFKNKGSCGITDLRTVRTEL
jgi:hypothetical protein